MTPSERSNYAQVVAESVVRDALNATPEFELAFKRINDCIRAETESDMYKRIVRLHCRWLLEEMVGAFDID